MGLYLWWVVWHDSAAPLPSEPPAGSYFTDDIESNGGKGNASRYESNAVSATLATELLAFMADSRHIFAQPFQAICVGTRRLLPICLCNPFVSIDIFQFCQMCRSNDAYFNNLGNRVTTNETLRLLYHCHPNTICVWIRDASVSRSKGYPDSKVYEADMGPTWGRQDTGGPHARPMILAIWGIIRCE